MKRANRTHFWRRFAQMARGPARTGRFANPLARLNTWAESRNPFERTFVIVCVYLAVVMLDMLSAGHEAAEHLYYVPIWLTAWYIDRRSAMVLAAVSLLRIVLEAPMAGEAHTVQDLIRILVMAGMYFASAWGVLALRQIYDHEHERARVDYLTEVMNTHGFYEAASEFFERSKGLFRPFSIVYVDLDHFKQLNDTRGHLEADRALRITGNVLRQSTRKSDIVGRLGGDEFAMILRGTGADMAFGAAERLRTRIDAELARRGWDVTASVGCIAFHAPPASIQAALNAADQLMYRAKKSGRSALVTEIYGDDSERGDRATLLPRLLVSGEPPSLR